MLLPLVYLMSMLACSIVGFVYYKDLKSRQLSFFPFYLLLIFIQELTATLLVRQDPSYSTGYIYNVYNPVNTLFYMIFYYHIPFNLPVRKLIGILVIVFITLTLGTFFFVKSIYVYNSYLSSASGFLITLCGILFLFNYFKLDNHTEEKKWLPVLWITIGLVAFYPVVNISFALHKNLLAYQATISGIKLYRLIPQLMSIFMYVCFIRAFYLCSRQE
ncbi:MAG: hypothetical protein ABI675_19710 [Chitinophagaceae bacterium]